MVAGLFHIAVKTGDLAATLAFYTRVLGLAEAKRPDFGYPGAWLAVPLPGGAAILHIYAGGPALGPEGRAPAGTAAIDHVSLACRGYHGFIARFREAGLEEGPPPDMSEERRYQAGASFFDPARYPALG
jgi:catechol 2,3-dioxygenase-like lactoylglutathione lyase family enzyme